MKLKSLEEVFMLELRDVYDAEKQITKALPKMIKSASSAELQAAFREHLDQTNEQIERLERIFNSLGESPTRKKCAGMQGLIKEASEILGKEGDTTATDAAMICGAQKVEHYEMAVYGCLRTWAQILGNDEAARLLQQTLDEEGETDKKLTEIAENLNLVAAHEEGGSEGSSARM
jgi:ferritin-like metal-binding protein YciE